MLRALAICRWSPLLQHQRSQNEHRESVARFFFIPQVHLRGLIAKLGIADPEFAFACSEVFLTGDPFVSLGTRFSPRTPRQTCRSAPGSGRQPYAWFGHCNRAGCRRSPLLTVAKTLQHIDVESEKLARLFGFQICRSGYFA